MHPADFARVKDIVSRARELAPDARAAYLIEVCAGDATLQAEVEALLAFDVKTPSILVTGGVARQLTPEFFDSLPKTSAPAAIGPYQILEILGEGGMGTVYRAEQTTPIHREVALKLIRRGLDTDRIVARFEAERQALALMDHAHIARVLDAGATADGRPYFVMELVAGEPITTFCETHNLALAERLALFLAVCQGVQHAHQKGIIHRDLKPSNVLVREQDGVATPKIIDFGISKVIADAHDAGSLMTQAGHVVGTPEYMSPEQAGVLVAGVDTRTDVYALGVLLYELLTGCRPFEFKTHSAVEIQRVLGATEAVKPSTAATLDAHAASPDCARLPFARWRRQLAGDLDNIIMKALAKTPDERYASVEQFADDVRRHVEGLPVRARPATWTYRTTKFVRRHRIGVAVATGVTILLVGFALSTAVQARRIAAERDRAVAAEQRARTEATTAQRVSAFLVDLFKVSDPGEARGNIITAREMLDRGAERIRTELADQPAVQTTLMTTIGKVYESLGLYEPAARVLDAALEMRTRHFGPRHPDTALTMLALAGVIWRLDDHVRSERLGRQGLDLCRSLLGPAHECVADGLYNLGQTVYYQGRLVEAERIFREALALGERLFGPEDPRVRPTVYGLAAVLMEQSAFDAAEPLFRRALRIDRKAFGEIHPRVAVSLNGLAWFFEEKGDYDSAEQLYSEALAVHRKLHDKEHPAIGVVLGNLGDVRFAKGDHQAAVTAYRESLAIRRKALGPKHTAVGLMMGGLARSLHALGQNREAEHLFEEGTLVLRKAWPDGHLALAAQLQRHGVFLLDRGNLPRAEAMLREALKMNQRVLPEDHPRRAEDAVALGRLLIRTRRFLEAEPLLLEAHAKLVAKLGPQHPKTRDARSRILELYDAWRKPELAEKYRPGPPR